MAESFLLQSVQGIEPLRGLFVTAMPDCLLYDSWLRDDTWDPEEVATYFGDLTRSNRSALRSLGSWSSDMQVTIESADALVILTEVSEHFICGFIFDRETPLGMVRLHLRRLIERIKPHLPKIEAEETPRGIRVVEFLKRYAPDAHAVLMRVSVRTGLPIDRLENAGDLSPEEVDKLEAATKRILGLEELNI